ncbi:von Willebrand factor A domain-containing protein 8, partial [Phenoliferia sp. Uapishka_3]
MSDSLKRLAHLHSSLSTPPKPAPELLGTLNLGSISLPIHATNDPERTARLIHPLDIKDPTIAAHLFWITQKVILGQGSSSPSHPPHQSNTLANPHSPPQKTDIFLLQSPGPFARRLALTFCSLLNRPFELVSLHRDVGESELKQGRELRKGGKLEYVDSPAVRAAKNGSILILDGIERCERGVLPILNNLLENREINLEDGTHIVSSDRYDLMLQNKEDTTNFIPAHRDFRVIAIGTPVPPYPGFPLDPPFRSRFQVRYLDPLASSRVLAQEARKGLEGNGKGIVEKTADAITAIQIAKEMRAKMSSGVTSSEDLPAFPQTSLLKLSQFLSLFPPPTHASLSTPSDLSVLLLSLHPALSYITPPLWRSLETAFEGAGLGEWVAGISDCDPNLSGVEDGSGIWGWELVEIRRENERSARLFFTRGGVEDVQVVVGAGPRLFLPYPLNPSTLPNIHLTPRFLHTLTSLFQLHSLRSFDISILPPSSCLQSSSSSTTLIIETFAKLLGYELETIHLVKDLGGGRELWMRRIVETGLGKGGLGKKGETGWEPSSMLKGAWEGKLVHLEGIDSIGATVGSLGRLVNDREGELWEGKRMVGVLGEADEELSSLFISLPTIAMPLSEEKTILLSTGCPSSLVDTLENFARSYRRAHGAPGSKSRRLGTASLLRMARRLAKFPKESLWELVNRTLLSEFLPTTDRSGLETLLSESGIREESHWWNPPAQVIDNALVFPAASDPEKHSVDYVIPLYDMELDPTGSSHVPFMNNYLDNSQQTALMRDIATDLEVLGEHVLLLGNQGVGKNKIVDRLLQLLKRPREFIQLHRDSTPQSLMFQTSLDGGVIRYVDSPLLRAVKYGRVIVIDETDKAAAHVVAGLASLASRGEMTLPDGRKIRPPDQIGDPSDIVVHPKFRMILLANRPGFPFLGNREPSATPVVLASGLKFGFHLIAFLRVLGDNFSCFAVCNPDADSEQRVLTQLAPDLDPDLLKSLVLAFGDLRKAFEAGTLPYPFSLRELLALVRHMKRFPEDELEQVLRNVFDFDINRLETIDALYDILRKHKLAVRRIGIDAARVGSEDTKKPVVIEFKPTGDTSLDKPKFGKAPDGKSHTGGNTWAGGTGGRDTAGLGGRGGYMRLFTGQDISQIPDELKEDVPDEIKNQAREMARKELAARLAEIDLTSGQASTYSGYHHAVQSHVHQLVTFLENLEANEEERIWLKRQSDGELDESKLTEGLTGEAAIYKRRGMEKPEMGAPQLKPKRIRFIFDLSASMYRNQYDGRLARSLEAAVMILESFARLSRKEKYRIDLVGQSGEEAERQVIPLVSLDALPTHAGERYKVIQKMAVIPQYAWAGDHTIEAITQGVADVADSDSDDFFLICLTDANFARYGITADDLRTAMSSNPKVKVSLIAIGEGAEAAWLPKALPGQAYRVMNTTDIATNIRAILGAMLSSSAL